MRIEKEALLTLVKIMSESAKLAEAMTIVNGRMALTIPSGFVVLEAPEIKFDFSVADIKQHARILKIFVTPAKLKNKTYLLEDEIDQVALTIHKLKYLMKKPLLSQKGSIEQMILDTELHELSSGKISNETIKEIQSLIRFNKDLVVRVDVGFNLAWEMIGIKIYLSDIDDPLVLQFTDLVDGVDEAPDMVFFNVDFMELSTQSDVIYNVYSQKDDSIDQDTVTVRFTFDEKIVYREFRNLPITGSIFHHLK
jgi:hypothetical protein